ncbi:MAG: hypothetical protein OQK12_09385 [Motiliproteus sp.]|nr:hypothetical protein [Motiliproteus sp.]MCW9053631.1 hypothetical protein [Motiliproteus sp.]
MRATLTVVLALLMSGCASVLEVTDKYYVCYHGDRNQKLCEDAKIPEGDERVCVNLVRDIEFDEWQCNKTVGQQKFQLF